MTNEAEAPMEVEVKENKEEDDGGGEHNVYLRWRFSVISRGHHHLVFAIDGVDGTLAFASTTYRGLHPNILESLHLLAST